MKTIRMVIVAVLMAASGGALNTLRAQQAVNPPLKIERRSLI